jgi:hypothetical protein
MNLARLQYLQYFRDYRKKNLARIRAYDRARHVANRAVRNAACRARHAANREEANARSRAWYAANLGRVKAYHANRRGRKAEVARLRRLADPGYRAAENLRNRVRGVLNGAFKSAPTMELLGCPVEFLREHLASQFSSGMTWNNYGLWEIDHIVPCAKFDLRHASEQRKCFHYSNLQPLWAEENRRKGAR